MKKSIPPSTAQLTNMISIKEGASIPTNSVNISNKVMAKESRQSLIVFSGNLTKFVLFYCNNDRQGEP